MRRGVGAEGGGRMRSEGKTWNFEEGRGWRERVEGLNCRIRVGRDLKSKRSLPLPCPSFGRVAATFRGYAVLHAGSAEP